ncbi:MAG TPA: hypothetical protein VNH80_11220 [Burkholderiales bacterium]|nr:hypothetical protein [Burkholderiales bacterium]
MKITANVAAILGLIFAAVCFAVVIHGYYGLGDIADPQQLADAKGFMMFWAFLGAIGVASGAGSWWLIRKQAEDDR